MSIMLKKSTIFWVLKFAVFDKTFFILAFDPIYILVDSAK